MRKNEKTRDRMKSQRSSVLDAKKSIPRRRDDPLGQMLPISNTKTENLPLYDSDGCGRN